MGREKKDEMPTHPQHTHVYPFYGSLSNYKYAQAGCTGLKGAPPKHVHILPPEPVHVTLFRIRIFAQVIRILQYQGIPRIQ